MTVSENLGAFILWLTDKGAYDLCGIMKNVQLMKKMTGK